MTTSILSLEDAKTFLRFPNPSQPSGDDVTLAWFLDAAAKVAEYHCGKVDQVRLTEFYNGGDCSIWLRHAPIVSVESVLESYGIYSFELAFQPTDMGAIINGTGSEATGPEASSLYAYSVDNYETGQITRRTLGNAPVLFAAGVANIQVDYVAGESSVPADVKLAVAELVSFWWRNSQLRAAVMSGTNLAYDAVSGAAWSREPDSTPIEMGVPWPIVQLLRSHGRMPIIA